MGLLARFCFRFGIVNEDGEPAIYWHSQNLSEDKFGRKKRLWRQGRGWLRTPWGTFSATWEVPTHFCHIGFEIGGGDGDLFGTELACWLFSLWFHYEPRKWRAVKDRSYQLSWHHGGLWCQWGTNRWGDMDDFGRVPRWRRWHFDPLDFLFGRQKHSERDLDTVATNIPTPEGPCPATIRFFESTWRRPRWPLAKHIDRAEINLGRPIPVPGKGENSWDCGEDAIYSLTCPAKTVGEAVAAVVESYTRTRERHGGVDWQPVSAGGV